MIDYLLPGIRVIAAKHGMLADKEGVNVVVYKKVVELDSSQLLDFALADKYDELTSYVNRKIEECDA